MLRQISVRDFAIIEAIEIELAGGMTVLTGETGAGKSIIIDAIGLLLGDRADGSSVRAGASQAELGALFEVAIDHRARQWLDAQALSDADSHGSHILLRRVVQGSGKSRAWINGVPVTIAQLRELGSQLVDIHGQHAHHQLLQREAQRVLLDGFVPTDALSHMRTQHREFETKAKALRELREQVANAGDRRDLLRFQIQELSDLHPVMDEFDAICVEQRRLAHAQTVLEALQSAADWLQDERRLEDPLQRILASLKDAQRHDERLAPPSELLDAARIQLREAGSLINRLATDIEMNPSRLQELDTRIADYLRLARKHRCEPGELADRLADMVAEMTTLDSGEDRLKQLETALQDARAQCQKAAAVLSTSRGTAAGILNAEVSAAMQRLGMTGGRFAVTLKPSGQEPTASGHDEIDFCVCTNPNSPLQPLARVASGGELSRIGLALQVLVSARQQVDTLIFDEVDTGVSGAVAEVVGTQLRALGAHGQVLCVTHLPQVAAQAHWHLQITKDRGEGQARTTIEPLEGEKRVEALARLLGGTKITRRTLAHAREMLSMAATQGDPEPAEADKLQSP
jgi:DNA repair protein RecN (Recombination protein N)